MSLNAKQTLDGKINAVQKLSGGEVGAKQNLIGSLTLGRPLAKIEVSEFER